MVWGGPFITRVIVAGRISGFPEGPHRTGGISRFLMISPQQSSTAHNNPPQHATTLHSPQQHSTATHNPPQELTTLQASTPTTAVRTYTYGRTHAYAHARTQYVRVGKRTYVRTYVRARTRTYARTRRAYGRTYAYAYVRVRTRTYAYVRVRTRTYVRVRAVSHRCGAVSHRTLYTSAPSLPHSSTAREHLL